MFKNIAQARKILEQEHLIVKLDAGEIDRYEFIRQLFNLRRYEPDIVIAEDEIEKQFDFIQIFRGAVEIANDMVSSEKDAFADGGVKSDINREQKLVSNYSPVAPRATCQIFSTTSSTVLASENGIEHPAATLCPPPFSFWAIFKTS